MSTTTKTYVWAVTDSKGNIDICKEKESATISAKWLRDRIDHSENWKMLQKKNGDLLFQPKNDFDQSYACDGTNRLPCYNEWVIVRKCEVT